MCWAMPAFVYVLMKSLSHKIALGTEPGSRCKIVSSRKLKASCQDSVLAKSRALNVPISCLIGLMEVTQNHHISKKFWNNAWCMTIKLILWFMLALPIHSSDKKSTILNKVCVSLGNGKALGPKLTKQQWRCTKKAISQLHLKLVWHCITKVQGYPSWLLLLRNTVRAAHKSSLVW